MRTHLAVLALLITLFGCQGANELTGPAGPDAAKRPERTMAAPDPRVHPVVVPRLRGSAVEMTRPQVVTPRLYPCLIASGDVEWKNEPCRPCDDVTTGFEQKNKPCHDPTPTPHVGYSGTPRPSQRTPPGTRAEEGGPPRG